jgi:hypothetical protein
MDVPDVEPEIPFPVSNNHRLWWAMGQALDKIENLSEREAFLEKSHQEPFSLQTGSHFACILGYDHGRTGSQATHQPPRVSAACFDRIANLVVEKLKSASANGELFKHPNALKFAFEWRILGGEADAQAWVRRVTTDDSGFVWFLKQAVGKKVDYSSSDGLPSEVPSIDASGLLTWFKEKDLWVRAKKILDANPCWLGDSGKEALQFLLETVVGEGRVRDSNELASQGGIQGEMKQDEKSNGKGEEPNSKVCLETKNK